MPKTTEDKILFSWVVALTAIIRITPTTTWVQDADGTTRTFDGGSTDYDINVSKVGNGKKKSQSITIRKKLPVCPLSGLPIPLGKGVMFKQGFALNQHLALFSKHHTYDLQPGYYCEIGSTTYLKLYAMVKIIDSRKMDSNTYQTLAATLNCDIADMIKEKLEDMTMTEYNFKMVENPIIPGKLYHRESIRKLVDDGVMEIGIGGIDYIENNVIMLTPEAYEHKFPNGGTTRLPLCYRSIDEMMQCRQRYIDVCL